MRGGGQRPFGTFQKNGLFWRGHPSLTYEVLEQKSWQKLELAKSGDEKSENLNLDLCSLSRLASINQQNCTAFY